MPAPISPQAVMGFVGCAGKARRVCLHDDLYDELEEQLILADVGGEVAIKLVDKLRDRVNEKGLKTGEQASDCLLYTSRCV